MRKEISRNNVRLSMIIGCLLLGMLVVPACGGSGSEGAEDLGGVFNGKADTTQIVNKVVTLDPGNATNPSQKLFTISSDIDFEVSLSYDAADAQTRIRVEDPKSGSFSLSEQTVMPNLVFSAFEGMMSYTITIENHSPVAIKARLSVLGIKVKVPKDVFDAAKSNLKLISATIDPAHLKNYGLAGEMEDRFIQALKIEYYNIPDQYQARMKALASMIMFSRPEILPPQNGNLTPFHGLDNDQFRALMNIEDEVFNHLVGINGKLAGVRPFSVCETKYMIEKFVRPGETYTDFESYKVGYEDFVKSCTQADIDEWYNFRGLGQLRPSWVESNVMDRFLRRQLKRCVNPTAEFQADCASWESNRLNYRLKGNRQLATRFFFYDKDQEANFYSVYNPVVLMEDRNGDGVGEFLMNGPAQTVNGETGTLAIISEGQFGGNLKFTPDNGTQKSINPRDLVAQDAVDPNFNKEFLDQPDMGFLTLFADPTGCSMDQSGALIEEPTPDECPLLKRFYVMIDRHEYFYQTFSALNPDYSGISSQPSPLVACSITLAASYGWAFAGLPTGATDGLIFLMRIPFRDVLTGSDVSVSTLQPGPDTLSIQDLYRGDRTLDFSTLWLDIASLSNNQYASEHEISKFGAVPASQIVAMMVVPQNGGGVGLLP